ncbi:MAG: GNAT family N-acetyltransferase [Mangrovicoccus sp.]
MERKPRKNAIGQMIGWPVEQDLPRPRPERVKLKGRYAKLAPLDPVKHGDDLFAALGSAEEGAEGVWTYMPVGPFPSRIAFDHWLTQAAQSKDPLFFAILDRDTGRALGSASLLRIHPNMGAVEIGFLLFGPELQRSVIATEAMALFMTYVFDELGYRRYEWKCDALNAPSRRAAERLGFVHEGIFRQAVVYKGRNRDTAWYSIIDTDWPKVKAGLEAWLDPDNFKKKTGQQKRRLEDCRKKP